ncbi:MAG: hypothetical protein IKR59_09560, partial [Lachnospiraceae bacterium]|nr:hypothetical protein [Lachnospiraceae bacterium]
MLLSVAVCICAVSCGDRFFGGTFEESEESASTFCGGIESTFSKDVENTFSGEIMSDGDVTEESTASAAVKPGEESVKCDKDPES